MSKNLRRLFFRGENKAVWEVPYAVRRRVGGGARWLASPSSIFFLSSPQTGFSPGEEEMGMTRSQHCRTRRTLPRLVTTAAIASLLTYSHKHARGGDATE